MQIFGVLLSLFFIIAGVIGLIRPKVLIFRNKFFARWQILILSILGFFIGAGITAIPNEKPEQQQSSLILLAIFIVCFILVGLKRKSIPEEEKQAETDTIVEKTISQTKMTDKEKNKVFFQINSILRKWWKSIKDAIKEEQKKQELRNQLLQLLKQFRQASYMDEKLRNDLKKFHYQGLTLLSDRERIKYAEEACKSLVKSTDYFIVNSSTISRLKNAFDAVKLKRSESTECYRVLDDLSRNYNLRNKDLKSVYSVASFFKNPGEVVYLEVTAQWIGKDISYVLRGNTTSGFIGMGLGSESKIGVGVGSGYTNGRLEKETQTTKAWGDLVITNQRVVFSSIERSFSIPYAELINYFCLGEQVKLSTTKSAESIELEVSSADAYAVEIVLNRLGS
ncbi:hypothetical protein ACLRAA_01410 [Gallibacterium anatis]|uniref:hypothetical protein n=1 Tax=Gallibacterium anatis TaxID=750 RepID=UPI0039FDBCF2